MERDLLHSVGAFGLGTSEFLILSLVGCCSIIAIIAIIFIVVMMQKKK